MKKSIFSGKVAAGIDWAIVVAVALSGIFHPDPALYYQTYAWIFAVIIIPLLSFGAIVYWYSERSGARIQGERKKKAPIGREIFGTTRAMFIVAGMAAWPTGLALLGYETGLVWTLEDMGLTWWQAVLQMWAGIIAIDAWTYWKHRFLHTKLFFPFHMHHHSFRDPTPFAGFAVGPFETILTFWPLLLICMPEAKHFAPFYFTAIVSFVLLNLYLHCGVTFKSMEGTTKYLLLNSSAWHNIHHSDTNTNFGEVSYIWDKMCGTTREKKLEKKQKEKEERARVRATV